MRCWEAAVLTSSSSIERREERPEVDLAQGGDELPPLLVGAVDEDLAPLAQLDQSLPPELLQARIHLDAHPVTAPGRPRRQTRGPSPTTGPSRASPSRPHRPASSGGRRPRRASGDVPLSPLLRKLPRRMARWRRIALATATSSSAPAQGRAPCGRDDREAGAQGRQRRRRDWRARSGSPLTRSAP